RRRLRAGPRRRRAARRDRRLRRARRDGARLVLRPPRRRRLRGARDRGRPPPRRRADGPGRELRPERLPARPPPGADAHRHRLDRRAAQMLIVTGPNMAGKSTFMRQVAQIVLLAQIGSFVPARRARVGIVDRILTRVGAADNLARGESTFMVEMRETAHILGHATRRSLVILDEIGRGTSTYDGVSIPWAVAEYLHDAVGAKTLFATHYHELTALATKRPRIANVSVAVADRTSERGGIVFLHRVMPGGASRSYGIDVARLAGLPRSVVARARQILAELERPVGERPSAQLPLLAVPAPRPSALEAALAALDPDRMTPLQALQALADLKQLEAQS